jgi:hypothetical protein
MLESWLITVILLFLLLSPRQSTNSKIIMEIDESVIMEIEKCSAYYPLRNIKLEYRKNLYEELVKLIKDQN